MFSDHILEIIQQHINRNHKRWTKVYDAIDGIHLGLKKKDGEYIEKCYAVVFHVTKKKKDLEKGVPSVIYVKYDGKSIKVPTDVIEVGKILLNNIKMGDEAKNAMFGLIGTISFFFDTHRGRFVGSNMHVLSPNLLNQGIRRYDIRKGSPPQRIVISDETVSTEAQLFVAQFGGIDFGLALVNNPAMTDQFIKNCGNLGGFFAVSIGNFQNTPVSFSGRISGVVPCHITSVGAIKNANGTALTNLIRLNRCTEDGDSGAPLFDLSRRLVGVIVGKDQDASYALHINDVISFSQSSNL